MWKVFSPADAVEVVLQHGDADAAAEAIVVEARKRWDELWQGANTTVAVVVFASPGGVCVYACFKRHVPTPIEYRVYHPEELGCR